MGLGIAYVAALNARIPRVLLSDKSSAQIKSSLSLMDKLLAKDVKKGKISQEDADAARGRVTVVAEGEGIDGLRDCDMVVEAASENLALKQTLFKALSKACRPDAILATNTSSISVTKIAASTIPEGVSATHESAKSAERVVGVHFFNPVPVMKLVELVPALQTNQDTIERSRAFAAACGKEVTTSKDVPGFVSNALLCPFLNEAIMCLEQGTATRDDIDKTLRLGMAHPMGPLQLADFIGLDTVLAIQQTLYAGTGDSKYRSAVLLERMVDAGWLGKKVGRGFYTYDAEGKIVG
jgi:3-hydroxybutyryl-CoA dehydrogenase